MSSYGAVDLSGTIASAKGVAACRPRSLTAYGSSTQDGTPTPEAPVAIQSVTGNLYRETLHAIGQTWTSMVSVTKADYNRYIVNGTSTGTHWLWGGGNNADDRLFVTLPAGTYTAVLGGADASKFSIATRGKINGSVTALSTSGNPNTFTIDSEIPVEVAIYTLANKTFSNSEVSIQLYEGSSADGTFVPYGSMGLKAVGKNLLDLASSNGGTSAGLTVTPNGDGTFAVSGTATGVSVNVLLAGTYSNSAPVLFTLPAGTYTLTDARLFYHTTVIGSATTLVSGRSVTFTLDEETPISAIRCPNAVTGTTYDTTIYPQLELGSTATAYQPYVGTVTPIDLQGHQLRSLPDGTRDELAVDSAGNVTLTQRVGVTTQATTDGISATVGTDAMSTTGDLSDGATVIYRLAAPQTIGLGTIDLPTLPAPEFTAWTVDSTEFEIRALLRTGHSPVMWDGEELSAGWVFVSDRHEQLLPRNVTTIDVPGRDGAIFGGVTQAVRQLTLSLYVLGRPDERAEHVRELAARLAVDGPRPLRFGDELTRMAIPNADQDGESFVNAERFEVTFTCPDPWLYGEVRTATIPSGGSVTIDVGGTAPTWPTITAAATGGSQSSWIVTMDDGSGIYAAIPSGTEYEVTADCAARTLMVNGETAMLPPAYDWPRLTPGSHTLTMMQGTGDATVTWQERWW